MRSARSRCAPRCHCYCPARPSPRTRCSAATTSRRLPTCHDRPARLRPDHRHLFCGPAVPSQDPQARHDWRHCWRVLVMGHFDRRQQCRLDPLLHPGPGPDRADLLIVGNLAGRGTRGAAHPAQAGQGPAGGPDRHLGGPARSRRRPSRPHRSGNTAGLEASVKIAVVGTGHVGGTLGRRWRAAGREVVYGSRAGSGVGPGGVPVVPVGDAVTGAGVVVLAVPGGAVGEVVAANAAALAGKVVIDAANRFGEPEVNSRAVIAAAAPGAGYVRAFNALGWENFADPPEGAVLFFAADPGARPVAEELITAVGLEPVFVGGAAACGAVDALLPLWFALVQHNGGNRRVALRIAP